MGTVLLYYRQTNLKLMASGSFSFTPEFNVSATVPLPNATRLPDGSVRKMPALGLGTWRADKDKTKEAVICAIKDGGYRMIDTANDYGNEHEVGEALNQVLSQG